jgi:Acetoacetate decarboxylase (ADC)
MALPVYAEIGSKKTFRAPYRAQKVRFTGFLLDAEESSLARICEGALTGPSGGAVDYRPALPLALLSFTSIGRLDSAEPPDANVGWVPEKEAAFWILTVAKEERLVWYIPYIFVDSPNALLTGRGVEGFSKEMAEIDYDEAGPLEARAWVFPEFTPETEVVKRPVVTARRAAEVSGAETTWEKLEDAVRGIHDELLGASFPHTFSGLKLLFHVVEGILEREVSLVFLKQVRDAHDSSLACYQAVVEAPIKVTGFRGGGFLPGRWDIDVPDYASHPVARDLGLDATKLRGVRGFWLDFDFRLEQGAAVWEAK